MKQIALLVAAAVVASAAFADSSLTWTTDQTGGLVLDGNVTITVPSGTSVTCSGVISGSGKLIKEGAGTLTLSNDNTYSGGTQVNDGKLIGTSDNPFGSNHSSNPIYVNTDLTDTRSVATDTSTAVIFAKAGTSSAPQTYGYPITCSTWSQHGKRPRSKINSGCSTLYNIALAENYIKLTGSISGGDISIRCGAVGSKWGSNADGKAAPAISGNITASGGTLALSSRATEFNLTGAVKVGAIYHPTANYWPTKTKLANSGNEIGWYDCGRFNSGGDVTAAAAGAIGGAVLISTTADFSKSGEGKKSQSFDLGNYNQTINYPTIDYFRPRSPSESVGMVNDIHSIRCVKTLTMKATATATNDWCFSANAASASLVWDPQGGDHWLYNVSRAHVIGGTITVNRGGFAMDENCSFSNATAIVVADGASFIDDSTVANSLRSMNSIVLGAGSTLSLPVNPFATIPSVETGTDATLNLSGDVTVEYCKVGDNYLLARAYSAGTHSGLTITGPGKLYVATAGPIARDTYRWLGGGADDNITTDGNWDGGVAPDFDVESPFIVFAGGTAAVLDRDISVSGVTFDGVTAFNLSASGNHALLLGAGGISNAPAASASTVTVSAPVAPVVDQVWQMDTNVTFTLSGILKRYGNSAPTLTIRQGSWADPTVTFIGAATAEGASDFVGDVVFEETPLGNNKYGVAYVRAVGYDPFGPGGTLMLKSLGEGHYNNNHGRLATFYLSNAVISKAFKFGPYYCAYIVAEDNSTNIFTGAFIPTKLHTTAGTFAPEFKVGTNSVLRLCGDMDFGTRKSDTDTADVRLNSTSSVVADMPTGTIAFDGRISRVPRRFCVERAIRVELNASDNVITNLNLRHTTSTESTATLFFGASYALSNGQAMVFFPYYSNQAVDFDLNGTVQHIKGFAPRYKDYKGKKSRISSSSGPGTLRVSQATDVEFDAYVATNVTLQMEGAATLTFTHDTAFEAGSTLAVSNGTVAVSSATALNENVTLKLLGGTISIPAGQTAKVGHAYYLDSNGNVKELLKGRYGPESRKVGVFFAPGSGMIHVRRGGDAGMRIDLR